MNKPFTPAQMKFLARVMKCGFSTICVGGEDDDKRVSKALSRQNAIAPYWSELSGSISWQLTEAGRCKYTDQYQASEDERNENYSAVTAYTF